MTEDACVFCRIVAGREPCSRVHEDDVSLGFMGIRPARPGELMIIPKEHVDHFCDIPDDLAAHILLVAQRLSRSIRRTLSPRRVGLVVHGFGVPHAHLIVVPQHEETDIISGRFIRLDGGRISLNRTSMCPVTSWLPWRRLTPRRRIPRGISSKRSSARTPFIRRRPERDPATASDPRRTGAAARVSPGDSQVGTPWRRLLRRSRYNVRSRYRQITLRSNSLSRSASA